MPEANGTNGTLSYCLLALRSLTSEVRVSILPSRVPIRENSFATAVMVAIAIVVITTTVPIRMVVSIWIVILLGAFGGQARKSFLEGFFPGCTLLA